VENMKSIETTMKSNEKQWEAMESNSTI
jgi:hypothetical protein